MDGVFEDRVRHRAYEIWVDLGRLDGQAHDNWIAAERELTAHAKAETVRQPLAIAETATPVTKKATASKSPASKTAASKSLASKSPASKSSAKSPASKTAAATSTKARKALLAAAPNGAPN